MPDYRAMVRREIFRARGELTDEELFTGRPFLDFLQRALDAATVQAGRPVRLSFLSPDSSAAALTDGFDVRINPCCSLVRGAEDRVSRYLAVLGLVMHETGHVLFTDFPVQKRHLRALAGGRWYPYPPDGEEAGILMKRVREDGGFGSLFRTFAASVRNIAEDVYVEDRLQRCFSGLFMEGLRLTAQLLLEQHPDGGSLFAKGEDAATVLVSELLLLARSGRWSLSPSAEIPDAGPVLEALERSAPFLSSLKHKRDSLRRCALVNDILVQCAPVLLRVGKHPKKAARAAGHIEKLTGPCPSGDQSPVEMEDRELPASSGSRPLAELDTSRIEEAAAVEKAERAVEEVSKRELEKEARELFTAGGGPSRGPRETADTERDAALRYGGACQLPPSAVRIHRDRDAGPALVSKYGELLESVRPLVRRTCSLLSAALSDRRPEGRVNGLARGRRIAARSACRQDGLIFGEDILPDGEPDLAVCVLVDESGSMTADGRSVCAARAAVLLDAVFRSVLAPGSHAVIGHTADTGPSGKSLDLNVYVDFDSVGDRDRFRIAGIGARDQNRDAMALQYCCERLLRRPQGRKLLIVLSDGVPLAVDYGGPLADRDLSEKAKYYRRRGVEIFAAAIGDSSSNRKVAAIYGEDRTIDCSDLSALPARLAVLAKNSLFRSVT